MKNKLIILIIICFFVVSCSKNRYKSELDFANKLAQHGLWQEAYFRWTKSKTKEKDSAAIHNNLAIYYEKEGKPEKAEEEYQKALKLDSKNSYILSNYEKFKQKKTKKENKKNES